MGRPRITSLDDLASSAVQVVRRAGVRGLTSRAVAAEAGVALGTVYRHAADLEHLRAVAAAQVEATFVADLERSAPVDRPLRPALATVAAAVLDRARTEPRLAELLALPAGSGEGSAVRGWISMRTAAATGQGEIGECDPDLVAAAAFGAVRGLMAHLIERAAAGEQWPRSAAATLAAGLNGLLPAP